MRPPASCVSDSSLFCWPGSTCPEALSIAMEPRKAGFGTDGRRNPPLPLFDILP